MKGKIILGLGTIGVTISSLSVVACSNKNKPKADKGDSDSPKPKSDHKDVKEKIYRPKMNENKYPNIKDSLTDDLYRLIKEFISKKGKKYFQNNPRPDDLTSSVGDIWGDWYIPYSFENNFLTITTSTSVDEFLSGNYDKKNWVTINYFELYDYAHSKKPSLYPYL